VAQVERFVGVPYLWGGRSARGIDCSALVQLALISGEVAAPRDSDMQAALVGVALSPEAAARRGDLIFWRGHVGVLTDPETILHANAHNMAVVAEPLAVVRDRIAGSGGGPVTGRRRLLSMAG
jgi:cell wall-associated NlpC family hydrolase